MSKNFFSEALRAAMQERHVNQAQLSEFLGVDPAYVSRWLRGSSPRIGQMKDVLAKLGWSLDRARPDYDPFGDVIDRIETVQPEGQARKVAEAAPAYRRKDAPDVKHLLKQAAEAHRIVNSAPVPVTGAVATADGCVALEDKSGTSFDTVGNVFPETNYAENALSLMKIEGDGMMPAFKAGDLLALRRILQPSLVPDGTVVVMEGTKKGSVPCLRRLIRVADRGESRIERLVGLPLAEGHSYLFFKPREVRLLHAVVGVISFEA